MPILPTAQLLKALISDPRRSKSLMRNPEARDAFSELLMRSPQAPNALSELLMRSPQARDALSESLMRNPEAPNAFPELLVQSPQARDALSELLMRSPQAPNAFPELLVQSPQARSAITELLIHSSESPNAFSESEPGKKPDQKKEHAGDEKVMSASEPRSPNLRQTYENALRSALRGWDIKGSGPAHWQCGRGNDRLVDEGERVRAKQGSPAEVEGMFAVARAKGWQTMAFSGSEAFKRNVIETALRSGCVIHAQSRADQKLLAEATREHQRAQAGKTTANAQQPEVRQIGSTLQNDDGEALPAPKKLTATAILQESQALGEPDRGAWLPASKQRPIIGRRREK